MADPKKVRWSQLKVGILGLSAFFILSVLIFLLTSSRGFFQKNAILYTYMDDASGMAEGTPVRLNGFTIGSLDKIQLTTSNDPKKTVQFQMKVLEKFLPQIPVDSVAGISAANLLGDKFINITKGRSPQTVKNGAEIKSLQAQDIPELMAQSATLLQSFQTIVNRIDSLLAGVEQGKGNIGKLLKDEELYNRLNGIATEGQTLLSDVRNGHGTLSKLIYDDALYQELRSPIKRVDALLADLQAGNGSAGKLLKDPVLYDEAKSSLTEIRLLLADLNAGKGTAGKLLKDDALHKRLDELVAKFNGTIDKINSGQGTLGQLIVNPELYNALNGATREFQSLAKDMRANPKKFLTIRLTLF
ncbi:MAG: Mammalian cell entry related domain protein [Candidatus Solibacter sp.]|nr:Mammalian cell entry related domain protein [Candidatus Solibacter sp.]